MDSSGNGRHGTACIDGDAPFPVPGKFGNAGRFDGIYQYANMGPGFNFTSSFTVVLWIALDDYSSCGPTGKSQHIVGTHHLPTPTGNGRGWGMYWDCDGLAWELTNSSGSAIASYGYVQPSPFPANGSWHHAALVYDSTVPSATLFWDGVQVYSESGIANVPSSLYDNGEPLTVNGLPYAPSAGAPGKVDQTRVYDRALSHAEIQGAFGETFREKAAYGRLLFLPLCTRDASSLSQDLYNSASFGINMDHNDAFYLSSDCMSLQPLVVDDEIHINEVNCGPGPYGARGPEFVLNIPIEQNWVPEPPHDITTCIPMGGSEVLFEALDTDRVIFGNTAVCLVRDCGIYLGEEPSTTLHWVSSDVEMNGIQSNLDVVSGFLSELVADQGLSRACDLGSFSDTTQVMDTRADPPVGDGYYYLVSGTCGQTIGYGNASTGPRMGLPPLAVCPTR
jgi:hypothetical protein